MNAHTNTCISTQAYMTVWGTLPVTGRRPSMTGCYMEHTCPRVYGNVRLWRKGEGISIALLSLMHITNIHVQSLVTFSRIG